MKGFRIFMFLIMVHVPLFGMVYKLQIPARQREMRAAIKKNSSRRVNKLWQQYKADATFKLVALKGATQVGRIKFIKKFINEGNFSSDELTEALQSVFRWGLNFTCQTCSPLHTRENHSRIMGILITAGADGDKLKKQLEEQETSLTDVIGSVRRIQSLEEIEGALEIVKKNKEES